MFASLAVVALASTVVVNAAPIDKRGQPSNWATGYLEDYDVYHTRYIALDCQDKHNTTFFDACCHPLLATETLASRPDYCTPNATEIASASSYAATATSVDADVSTEFGQATASVESVYESLTSATPTATVDTTTVVTATPTSSSDDWDDATATTTLDALATALSANNAYAQASSSSTSTWVAPTSTWSPAPATTTASSGGSGDVKTGGFATYFYQNGNPGACGTVHSDSEYGIAIDGNGYWQNYGVVSPYCGKQITITNNNNGKSVTATVWDVCPTCDNDNSLDLSVGAFTAIASESDGMVPITWQWA